MNLHALHYSEVVSRSQKNALLCHSVGLRMHICNAHGVHLRSCLFLSVLSFRNQIMQRHGLIILIFSSITPLLPPQGGQLNTQPLLMSWWSNSVPVLYNSPRTHSSATPPPVFPFFFLPFERCYKELASAPLETIHEMFWPSDSFRI